ncbi:hypothetical protein IscW_ISCW010111 [Ixodes scapularis]|uniref:Uncharacterized protein n=1 Tax=Ixodes scapularis TaxID=6945 RepID=B7PXJ1_IXOSC|nr:hypothetical protein IscW_ISCW010111 [Ixodes scapularis]|eukprot:XP_002400994.1 hypothetical protein IscW_ISCW010111 [Ixodes scapularis]
MSPHALIPAATASCWSPHLSSSGQLPLSTLQSQSCKDRQRGSIFHYGISFRNDDAGSLKPGQGFL